MTFKKWYSLYKAYKSSFDIELVMKHKCLKYADIEKEVTIDDVIPV
jgi:hypothetical protein